MPTHTQLLTAASHCQWFSNCYQPIQVFRYEHKFRTIYIQAGDGDNVDIAILIDEDGIWEFA